VNEDPDIADVCDEVWHGTNGEDLSVMSGCPGCHYVAGAAALQGLIGMAKMIAARERAKPIDTSDMRCCGTRHPARGRIICNLFDDHDGHHEHINRMGQVRYRWPADDRRSEQC
jgi:hypothetical protein